jgi:hypothetical protein
LNDFLAVHLPTIAQKINPVSEWLKFVEKMNGLVFRPCPEYGYEKSSFRMVGPIKKDQFQFRSANLDPLFMNVLFFQIFTFC